MICQQSFKSSKIDFSQFAEQQYYRKHNNHQMSNKSDNREVSNIIAVLKRDANGRPIHGVYEGTNIRIRLFDDRERVLFFKASFFIYNYCK
jgi:hypothetical protein